jgi:ABC-2 type transport system permease protein
MNIFRQELKQNRNTTIIWTMALIAIAALYISIFPSIAGNTSISDIYKNFPEAFQKAFNINENTLTAFSGLYALVLNLVLLTGAVQAMNLGTASVSKEVRHKTADFLLTKPVSRASILRQKLLSVFLLLLLTDIVFLAVDWLLIQAIISDPFQFRTFVISSLSLVFIQVFFAALGFLLGSVLPRVKSVIAVTLPVVFGFYIIGLLDTVVGVNKIKFLTPFKFFDVNAITAGGGYEAATLIYLAVLTAIAVIASFTVYQRKDIHTI